MKTTHTRSQHGFTLVELVVSICIATVVAVFIVMFIRTPVENYMAQSRRAELITEADLIERNLAQDIRTALPNSTRTNGTLLEMIPIVDMAIYRPANSSSPPNPAQELDIGTAETIFQTLGTFNRGSVSPNCALKPFQLVVGQGQGSPAQDLYQGGSVVTPAGAGVRIKATLTPPPLTRFDTVQLCSPFTFVSPSPNFHAFLVTNPMGGIAYECDLNTHTLKRFERYPVVAGVAANRNAAARVSIISNDVTSCNFNRSLSTNSRGDLVTASLQLTRSGETQTVFIQQAVENLP